MAADRSTWPDENPLEEAVREALRSELPAPFAPESVTAIIAAAIDAAWLGSPPGAGDDPDDMDGDVADDGHVHGAGWLDADEDLANDVLDARDDPVDSTPGSDFEDV